MKEVRLKGNNGYVVFTRVAMSAEQQALSVMREGGRWRLVSAIALPITYASPAALVRMRRSSWSLLRAVTVVARPQPSSLRLASLEAMIVGKRIARLVAIGRALRSVR